MKNPKIQEKSLEFIKEVIEKREPLGLFIAKEGDKFVGVDNTSGDAWTEDFPTKELAEYWLLEDEIVSSFRRKTNECFHTLDSWKPKDVENFAREHVKCLLKESDIDFDEDSVRVVLSGSRARGIEKTNSDIDIVVEIDTHEREDFLFNIIHEDEFHLPFNKEIKIDVNPITPYETGRLEDYLPEAEKYLFEKVQAVNSTNGSKEKDHKESKKKPKEYER